MARNSNGYYDRVITLRLVTEGDSQHWDWETLLDLNPVLEKVEILKVEDLHELAE